MKKRGRERQNKDGEEEEREKKRLAQEAVGGTLQAFNKKKAESTETRGRVKERIESMGAVKVCRNRIKRSAIRGGKFLKDGKGKKKNFASKGPTLIRKQDGIW